MGVFLIKNNINNVNGRNNRVEEVIERNYSKFENEVNVNLNNPKNKYKFRNPLTESNNIKLESLQRIVNECKIYSIGANYFIIYLYIKNDRPINEIAYYIDILEDRLNNFINFSETYLKKNIMNILQYEKINSKDIINQNDEKIEFFYIMKDNVGKIKKQIDSKRVNSNVTLIVEKKELIKNLIKKNRSKFSSNTINYFFDLGIYFLYDVVISDKNNNCCQI